MSAFRQTCLDTYASLSSTWRLLRSLPGVTDGSEAQPGTIGEFIQGTTTINYQGFPNGNIFRNVSVLTVPPGDWDLWTYSQMFPPPGNDTALPGLALVQYQLEGPLPPGLSGYLQQIIGGELKPTSALQQLTTLLGGTWPTAAINMQFYLSGAGPTVRGNFCKATPLNFLVFIDCSTAPGMPSGQFALTVSGRRRR